MKITLYTNDGPIETEVDDEVYGVSQESLEQSKASKAAFLKQIKRNAFASESDPLFFKAQRGEATIEEWKAKVDEIKARFADPG